jgi:Mn-dependent DtxR family transcriptional regulator
VLAATLTLLFLFFKELTLVSFDSMLARSLGFSPTLITSVFLMLVSTTIVASFEAVGSILVITMLVAPAATAHLLTDRLKPLITIAAFAAAGSASLGYVGAVAFNTSVAGMISCAAYLTFLLALFFGPRYGLVPRLFQRWFRRMRVAEEDILGVLFRAEERQGQGSALSLQALHAILASSAPRAVSWIALKALTLRSEVSRKSGPEYKLSPKGRDAARSIVRGHRLWEAFLDKYLNLPLDHLHEPSHRVEHFITPDLQRVLESHVKTEQDPHGRVIPNKKADNDN